MARVDVVDDGQGISQEFLPRVFEMFSQADGGGRRDAGGLGIGLSIVKQVVEMHGGRITIHSEGLGKGTQCRVWLPTGVPNAIADERSSNGPPNVLLGLKVLLVDDAEEALEALSSLMQIEGAIVHAAASGERALEIVAENDVDIIISDIGMPTMDGYALLAALRASPHTAAIPVIALTGFGRRQDVAKALRASFNAHLAKPVLFPDLTNAIAALVKSP